MRRRDLITLLGSAAAWPLAARAQQGTRVIRIGFLGPNLGTPTQVRDYQAFLAELRRLGFVEGRNLIIEYRRFDDPRGPFAMAADLIRAHVDLLVAHGPEIALQAAVGASRAIPIVFVAVNYDPIERGYATSLARPGGNVTGVFLRQPELAKKQLELLSLAFPDRTRIGVLWDAQSASQFSSAEDAAKLKQLELRSLKLENPPYNFDAAFQTLAQGGAQMVLVLSSALFVVGYGPPIGEIAIRHRLPTMFIFKGYVADGGGLMSYGAEQTPMLRRAASYVAQILEGAKPADLPIEQTTEYVFAVNLKTAKAIGVTIPVAVLIRANEVIE